MVWLGWVGFSDVSCMLCDASSAFLFGCVVAVSDAGYSMRRLGCGVPILLYLIPGREIYEARSMYCMYARSLGRDRRCVFCSCQDSSLLRSGGFLSEGEICRLCAAISFPFRLR